MKNFVLLFMFTLAFVAACAQSTFYDFAPTSTAQSINLKKMNDGYNYILFIGYKDSLYSIDWENQKLPYEYAYQQIPG